MRRIDGKPQLERGDVIKMNQLIRNGIDYEGFARWFDTLDAEEQSALVGDLCQYAYQAGVDEGIYTQALEKSGFNLEDEFVLLMKRVKSASGVNFGGLADWLSKTPPDTRGKALKWFVYLFGAAETRRFLTEDPNECNHWWHRDLNDPQVVNSLMRDPEFFRTSRRDDQKIR